MTNFAVSIVLLWKYHLEFIVNGRYISSAAYADAEAERGLHSGTGTQNDLVSPQLPQPQCINLQNMDFRFLLTSLPH